MGTYTETPCVICDIDGTLADVEHRRHFVQGKKKDFMKFYEAMDQDAPMVDVIGMINLHWLSGWTVILCTGRPERYRARTTTWLKSVGYLPPVLQHTLRMRPEGREFDPDYAVKQTMLDELIAENYVPKMAFDDRNQVVAMWRRNGIRCYQVAEGDF